MRSLLFHIYGPLSVHSFGLMIAVGVLVFAWCLYHHPSRRSIISDKALFDTLVFGSCAGVIGARLLYLATNWQTQTWDDILNPWQGGRSMLGTTLAALTLGPWFLARQGVPILPFFDLVALYAPLAESICRIGCFFAGCCFGKTTDVFWAITYTDPYSSAPLGIALHPTQLYASFMSLCIFIVMYKVCQQLVTRPGQLLALYLILSSCARFMLDFIRDDQEYFASPALHVFSVHQWLSLGIIALALLGFVATTFNYTKITHKQ